ncbi:hypothetical protein [Anaerorhabdus sp.]|uniref:hypothetical protein n=1 Tax=Anaerorhabdus sp. TaxID=1872524 RepID=UPI002FC933C2
MKEKYFRYLIKNNKTALFIIMLIGCILLPIFTIAMKSEVSIEVLCSYIVIISILLPLIYLSYIHKKDNINFNLNLPINKTNIWITRVVFVILIIWIQIVLNVLLLYLFSPILEFINQDPVKLMMMTSIQITIILLFGSFVLVSIMAWIISKCNNVIDSIFCSLAYLVLPLLFVLAINIYINSNSIFLGMLFIEVFYRGFSPITLIGLTVFNLLGTSQFIIIWILQFIYIVIGFICFVASIKEASKHRAEEAGENTNKFYLFPLIAVLSSFSLMLIQINQQVISFLFIFIFFIGVISLGKRKVHMTKKNVITFVLLALVVVGFNFVFHKTRGFGLEKKLAFHLPIYTKYTINEVIQNKDPNKGPTIKYFRKELFSEQKEIIKEYMDDYIDRYHEDKNATLVEFANIRGQIMINSLYDYSNDKKELGFYINLNEDDFNKIFEHLEQSGFNTQDTY